MYRKFIKPSGDFFIGLFLFIVLFPIIFITGIILFFANDGKLFFIQQRSGLFSKPFNIIKFKTMIDAFDDDGFPLPDHLRLTKLGKFVRSTSLDELPQIINVLNGDMSLVGPRPLLTQYLTLYTSKQSRRHIVKPGITGWAQVNGRNSLSWEEKFDFDFEYTENISFLFDMKILLLTIINVLRRKGISAEGSSTMEEFKR